MTGHTPGPWIVGDSAGANWAVVAPSEGRDVTYTVARVFNGIADARLIAAAPALLEAAEALIANTPSWTGSDGGADWPDRCSALCAAITQAKGE